MRTTAFWLLTVSLAAACHPASLFAQQQNDPGSYSTQSNSQQSPPPSAVPTGTRFLVALNAPLGTKESKAGQRFSIHTLEALIAPDGSVIPASAEIRGHVSRVEPGGTTGRARLWLSFDDVQTPTGWLPIVAEVTQVPGEHSVKQGDNKEGEIESRTSAGAREFQAAAAGAALGVSAGAAKGNGREAAIGAAAGAVAGFLSASGYGLELELMQGTKLELELLRPLNLGRR